MARSRFPDAPSSLHPDAQRSWGELIREIESFTERFYSPGQTRWVVTNCSITTSINVSAATDTYTANLLGSLITKLKNKGIL